MKRLFAIGIIFLFIGMTISSSTGFNLEKQSTVATLDGNTLYVGGNGSGNYTRIQDAIDNASDGDTIYVYDDSSPYYENLIVDKSISLIGENKHTTVIDGNEKEDADVILVKADGVTVRGFTIQNATIIGGSDSGHGIEVRSHNNTIKDNIITDNMMGIQIGEIPYIYSNNSIIEGNIITGNNNAGVYIVFSYNNIVSGNIISSNKYHGVVITYESSNNLVTLNNISLHEQDGVFIHYANNNTIQRNTIIGNKLVGVSIGCSSQNKVLENNIFNNKINAMVYGETIGLLLDKWLDNTFDGNYWGRPRIFPKLILAACLFILPNLIWTLFFQLPPLFIPMVVFDLHPAQEPYDI